MADEEMMPEENQVNENQDPKEKKPKKEKAPKEKKSKPSKSIEAGQLYQYDAFISYRHIQPDKAIAENLHKQLENFKLPKNVKASLANGHTRIERVFRDEDELPIASSLEDAIVTALQNSEWLIVICSPRILESAWCRLEISTFIRLHGRDHVLAVLVEGEPDEAIPEELLYEEVTTINAIGVPEVTKKRVEPLACDIRDKSTKKMVKNLESQKLRLLAKMFNLNYDDLRQRHREKAMRRKLKLASIAAAIMFVIFLVASVGFIAVYLQNQKINEQNVELAAQADLIESQNVSLLRSQAINTANNSIAAYEAGDRHLALQLAYDSVTSVDDNDMPFTEAGYRALTQALNVYEDPGTMAAFSRLMMPATVIDTDMTDSGQYFMAVDQLGNLYIWDSITLVNVAQITGVSRNFSDSTEFAFALIDDARLMYVNSEGLHQYNFTNEEDILVSAGAYSGLSYSRATGYVAAVSTSGGAIDVIDTNTLTVAHSFSQNDIFAPMANSNTITEDGWDATPGSEDIDVTGFYLMRAWAIQDHLIYAIDNIGFDLEDDDLMYLRVIDLNDMSMIRQYQMEATSVEKAMVINGNMYFISHVFEDLFYQHETIGKINLETNELLWDVQRDGFADELKCSILASGEVLITYSYDRLVAINGSNGEIIGECSGFGGVAYLQVGENYIYVVGEDNFGYIMNYENGKYRDAIGMYYVNSPRANITNTERVNIGTLEYFVTRSSDNYIYVFREVSNPDLTSTSQPNQNIAEVYYRDTNDYTSIISRLNSDEPINGVNTVLESDDGSVVVTNMSNNTFNLYVDDEFVGSYDSSYFVGAYFTSMDMNAYYGTDSEGNMYIAYEGLYGLVITPSGEVLAAIDGLCGYDARTDSVIRSVDGEYYSQPLYEIEDLISMAEVTLGAY